MQRGNYAQQRVEFSNREFQALFSSFEEMLSKIDHLINQQLKLEIAEKSAQFKAMQAQISPHFLYNALENINCSLIV